MTEQLGFKLARAQRESKAEQAPPRKGFVGYDEAGHFVHYCHCGKWGAFGRNVFLRQGLLGTWFCREHSSSPAQGSDHAKPKVKRMDRQSG